MAKRKTTNPTGPMRLYKSYMFTNKDPAIDELRTVMADEYGTRNFTSPMFEAVHIQGGPTKQTIHNWFYGEVRRPSNASLEAAGRALGKKRVWVDDDSSSGRKRADGKAKREATPDKKE